MITESDIFGAQQKKKKRHRTYEGEKIQSFTDLSGGDYVVHENHGLGIYRGIEKLEVTLSSLAVLLSFRSNTYDSKTLITEKSMEATHNC